MEFEAEKDEVMLVDVGGDVQMRRCAGKFIHKFFNSLNGKPVSDCNSVEGMVVHTEVPCAIFLFY